jgi:AAA15 family ATPase/GTPase
VTRSKVVEEKLVDISAAREKLLYHREDGKDIDLHLPSEDTEFLKYAFQGTRSNQLFLTNSVSQNVKAFFPIYDWFKDTLQLISPGARYAKIYNFFDEKYPLYTSMGNMLQQLDTGISHVGIKDVQFDDPKLRDKLRNMLLNVEDGIPVRFNDELIATKRDGNITMQTLVTYHGAGADVPFTISEESDGSQRIMNLLPAFLDMSATGSKRVYVIDEFDRSLHTLLTRRLIEAYLGSCSADSRSQFIFTAHDVLLMNQNVLRRDEIWCAERDATENSTLISFNDYKDVRSDKDIQKSYLQGRFGGIPSILLGDKFNNYRKEE